VLGTVTDESGAVLPGASVTLTHNAMGISARTFTDENGHYQFVNVKIGNYRVEVQMASFSAAVIDNVQVAVGARQRVDFSLKLGALNTTIEVAALAASVLEADTSDRGHVVNQRQIVELPLNGRNYSDLALLTTDSSQPFGNAGRNVAHSYSLYQLDLGMAKSVKLSE
jgi:hypothetical protein